MKREKIFKQYFVEELKDLSNNLTGWRVIETTAKKGNPFEVRTKLEGWLKEFNIRFDNLEVGGIIMVDPDCPSIYDIDSENIVNLVNDCLDSDNYYNSYRKFIGDSDYTIRNYTINGTPILTNDYITIGTSNISSTTWTASNLYRNNYLNSATTST